MALFNDVVEAFVASKEWDQATLSRLAFWSEQLGEKELLAITPEDIDLALVKLAERGRLRGGKMITTATGKPIAGSTLNRYISQVGSVFKYAKRLKLVPRAFISPTLGIERAPERADPDRYLREEEVARLIAVSRVLDRRWGKMTALIVEARAGALSLMMTRGASGERRAELDALLARVVALESTGPRKGNGPLVSEMKASKEAAP